MAWILRTVVGNEALNEALNEAKQELINYGNK